MPGNALSSLRQWDEAILSCEQALKINPEFAQAHNNLGNALRGCGQWDAAAESYRRAIAINPVYATAHTNLGNCAA